MSMKQAKKYPLTTVERLELLVVHDEFVETVSSLRQRFNMPSEGFVEGSPQYEEWLQYAMKLTDSSPPSLDVFRSFANAVNELRMLFNFPDSARRELERFVKFGKFSGGTEVKSKVELSVDDAGRPFCVLTVYEPLSKDQWSDMGPFINSLLRYRQGSPKHARRHINLKRDIEWYQRVRNLERKVPELVGNMLADDLSANKAEEMRMRERARKAIKNIENLLQTCFPPETFGSSKFPTK